MIKDLVKPAGVINPGNGGGLGCEFYFAPKSFLSTQPVRDALAKTKVSVDLAFSTGNRLIKIYSTKGKTELNCKKAKGDNADCFGYNVSVKGSRPGIDEDGLAFLHEYDNVDGYIIAVNKSANGMATQYILGTDANPISLSDFECAIGAEVTNSTHIAPVFECVQELPMGIYTGALQLEPAV